MLPEQVMLTKQPIYSANNGLFAYELLFRSPFNLRATDVGSDLATNQVLMNYSSCVSEQSQRYKSPMFINVGVDMLLSKVFFPVDSKFLIVEIAGAKTVNKDLLNAVKSWQKKGFKVSLENAEHFLDLGEDQLGAFDFLKFNVDRLDLGARAKQLTQLIASIDAKFMASMVESEAQFDIYKELGFAYFQGYFLAKPKEVLGRSIKAGTAAAARVLNALDRPSMSMDEIADLVSQDAKLSLQMLKIVNSPLFRLPAPVDELKKALVFLGADQLRQWTMLIAFVSNGESHLEASRVILMRAKLCQLLAENSGLPSGETASAFLIGLISGVDVLFKTTVSTFLEHINLARGVERALLEAEGNLGACLSDALKMQFDFAGHEQMVGQYDESVRDCFLQADDWSREVIDLLKQ